MVLLITLNAEMNLNDNVTRCIQVRIAKFLPYLPSSKEERGLQVVDYLCVAYSPQLGTQLKISHTKLNVIALAGNGVGFRPFSSSLPDVFQSGFIALVRYGDELWILMVLAYPLRVVLYAF